MGCGGWYGQGNCMAAIWDVRKAAKMIKIQRDIEKSSTISLKSSENVHRVMQPSQVTNNSRIYIYM